MQEYRPVPARAFQFTKKPEVTFIQEISENLELFFELNKTHLQVRASPPNLNFRPDLAPPCLLQGH